MLCEGLRVGARPKELAPPRRHGWASPITSDASTRTRVIIPRNGWTGLGRSALGVGWADVAQG